MTQPTNTTPDIVQLETVSDSVQIQDMNYIFNYKRLVNPSNLPADLFALFYKEQQQEQWTACRGLLSEEFTVVKTEFVIRQIQEALQGQMTNEKHYRSDTAVKSTFFLNGYQLNLQEDSEVDKVIFQLITNIDTDLERLVTSSCLSFNIINGFSGNHALQLNYGIHKSLLWHAASGESGQNIPINNVFILDKFTKRLIHDGRLQISFEDVVNVQQHVTEQITAFKLITVGDALIGEFERILPKKFMKKFMTLFEAIPEQFRNLYHCTYIFSMLLVAERKIELEIKMRAYISKFVVNFIKAREATTNRA